MEEPEFTRKKDDPEMPEDPSRSADSRSRPQSRSRIFHQTERLLLEYSWLVQAAFLIGLVAIALSAIAEIAARQSLLSFIESEVEIRRAEVVDLTRVPTSDASSHQQVVRLRDEIYKLQRIKGDCASLLAIGADSSIETIRVLRERLQFIRYPVPSQLVPARPEAIVTKGLRMVGLAVDYLPIDHLLAIAVISCGAIGSFISTVRRGRGGSMKCLVLGMASGFVTFLAIKGGRHVFLVQVGADTVTLNPYSSAFAGLLAGLFTERAYHLLSRVVDKFADKLEKAMAT